MAFVWIKGTCTGKVSEIPRDNNLPVPRVQAFIFLGLPVIPETFKVSLLFGRDRLGDPLAIPPGWCSLHVAPPVTEVLDHLKRVAVNGQAADTLKIGDIVNRFKPINAIQSIRRLGTKLDSLLRHERNRLDPLLVEVLCQNNDNAVASTELDNAVED